MHQELAPRVKRTQQQMFALIKEQQTGTMTVKEFCEVNKISEALYYYWRKKYQDNTKSVNEPQPDSFSLLQLGEEERYGCLFAEYKGLKLYQPVAVSYLKELMS
jgi:hypothetical protein